MHALLRSDNWRFRWLPLMTALAGVITAYFLQEVPLFRRHALLVTLLIGIGFFVPAIRHRLLILFAYGLSLYFLSKSLSGWFGAPLGEISPVDRVAWVFVGLLCGISAVGMGQRYPPAWTVSTLLVALAIYFATYTYAELRLGNWLQVLAGFGLMSVAFVQAVIHWVEGSPNDSRKYGQSQR